MVEGDSCRLGCRSLGGAIHRDQIRAQEFNFDGEIMRSVIVALMLFILPGSAFATDHGVHDCGGECLLGRPLIDIDTHNFLRAIANVDIRNWQPGDTITVCNTTTCATYVAPSTVAGLAGLTWTADFPRSALLGGSVGVSPGDSGGTDWGSPGFAPPTYGGYQCGWAEGKFSCAFI